MEMNEKTLRAVCDEHGLYQTPELNDKLYLHYKGFGAIRNLDRYTGLKCLWLEGNCIERIENLPLPELRCLYLQQNIIEGIDETSLTSCTMLNTLDLSRNAMVRVENLSHLTHLTTLILGGNRLADADSVAHVAEIPNLQTLDIQSNRIHEKEEAEAVVRIMESCESLRVLHLKGNKIVTHIPHYRKTVISRCRELRYLDERPVFDDERRRCDVWGGVLAGGGTIEEARRAEVEEGERIRRENRSRDERSVRQFRQLLQEGKQRRAEREAAKLLENENGSTSPASDATTVSSSDDDDDDDSLSDKEAVLNAREGMTSQELGETSPSSYDIDGATTETGGSATETANESENASNEEVEGSTNNNNLVPESVTELATDDGLQRTHPTTQTAAFDSPDRKDDVAAKESEKPNRPSENNVSKENEESPECNGNIGTDQEPVALIEESGLSHTPDPPCTSDCGGPGATSPEVSCYSSPSPPASKSVKDPPMVVPCETEFDALD